MAQVGARQSPPMNTSTDEKRKRPSSSLPPPMKMQKNLGRIFRHAIVPRRSAGSGWPTKLRRPASCCGARRRLNDAQRIPQFEQQPSTFLGPEAEANLMGMFGPVRLSVRVELRDSPPVFIPGGAALCSLGASLERHSAVPCPKPHHAAQSKPLNK